MNTTTDMIRRLATSQARGTRQLSYVNELLSFQPVRFRLEGLPVWDENGRKLKTRTYGLSKLRSASYLPLKRRLIGVGFVLAEDKRNYTVLLGFPEVRA